MSGIDPRRVYACNVEFNVNAKELKRFFSDMGFEVVNAYVPADPSYAKFRNKGYGFIEFQSAEDAAEAIEDFNNASGPRNRKLRLKIAEPRAGT